MNRADPTPVATWENRGAYHEIRGKNCSITLEPRPSYCDRGRFIAKLHGFLTNEIDVSDGFPRYYFDENRAKLELEAWLDVRGQRQ